MDDVPAVARGNFVAMQQQLFNVQFKVQSDTVAPVRELSLAETLGCMYTDDEGWRHQRLNQHTHTHTHRAHANPAGHGRI